MNDNVTPAKAGVQPTDTRLDSGLRRNDGFRLGDYLELCKPRIALLVALTVFIGYWLAGGRDLGRLLWTLCGATLAAGATGTLNQHWERERDARMRRTARRPLPRGAISPSAALVFGLALATIGTAMLGWRVNALTAGLTLFTIASYILAYTPLKAVSPQSTWVGSVSGAMPPLIGWAAARGSLDAQAWALFAIQFVWQIPHFLALFWLYREEYARAGFKVMPVVDPGGRNTSCQIALHSFALIPASLLPALMGMAKLSYAWPAMALGLGFLLLSLRASWTMAERDAKRMFLGSLAYLPLVWILLVAGQAPAEATLAPDYGRVPEFSLTDASGRPFGRDSLDGPWIADFIYTHCASQCPIVTRRLRELSQKLPGVRIVSFSVDSEDRPADLARFAKAQGAGWTFLAGKPGEVERLCTKGFHLPAGKSADALEPMLHSTKLVLVDKAGAIRGYFDSEDDGSMRRLEQLATALR